MTKYIYPSFEGSLHKTLWTFFFASVINSSNLLFFLASLPHPFSATTVISGRSMLSRTFLIGYGFLFSCFYRFSDLATRFATICTTTLSAQIWSRFYCCSSPKNFNFILTLPPSTYPPPLRSNHLNYALTPAFLACARIFLCNQIHNFLCCR